MFIYFKKNVTSKQDLQMSATHKRKQCMFKKKKKHIVGKKKSLFS